MILAELQQWSVSCWLVVGGCALFLSSAYMYLKGYEDAISKER